MNLIIISDIYENDELINELVDEIKAKNLGTNNIVLIAGDLGSYSSNREENYLTKLRNYLKKLLEISCQIIYVPGESDKRGMDLQMSSVINVHDNYALIDTPMGKIGIIGYGGAPLYSIKAKQRRFFSNLWDEKIISEDVLKSLKMNYEKLRLSNPDYIILLTHTPPYGIADYSKEIAFDESLIEDGMTEPEQPQEIKKKKKKTVAPKHLGSKAILSFIKKNKVDVTLCGHVHKEGGKVGTVAETPIFNVSHFDPLPYKLTGRKFLIIEDIENLKHSFHSLTEPNIPFEDYIGSYL